MKLKYFSIKEILEFPVGYYQHDRAKAVLGNKPTERILRLTINQYKFLPIGHYAAVLTLGHALSLISCGEIDRIKNRCRERWEPIQNICLIEDRVWELVSLYDSNVYEKRLMRRRKKIIK